MLGGRGRPGKGSLAGHIVDVDTFLQRNRHVLDGLDLIVLEGKMAERQKRVCVSREGTGTTGHDQAQEGRSEGRMIRTSGPQEAGCLRCT
jgi:hypothetical protein